MKRAILFSLMISITMTTMAAIQDSVPKTPPVPVDTTHYYYDTTTTLIQYIINASTGESATGWARLIVKSKMDWANPTKEELEKNDQLTLKKKKTPVAAEYYLVRTVSAQDPKVKNHTIKTVYDRVIPINNYQITPEQLMKAVGTVDTISGK